MDRASIQGIRISFAWSLYGVSQAFSFNSPGDVSEANGQTTWPETYSPRGIMRLTGLGNDCPKLSRLLPNTSELCAYDGLVRLKTT